MSAIEMDGMVWICGIRENVIEADKLTLAQLNLVKLVGGCWGIEMGRNGKKTPGSSSHMYSSRC